MRKSAAIVLLFSLFAPVFLPGLIFNMKKTAIQNQVETLIQEGIKEEQLTVMQFTVNELNQQVDWEHPGEFEYQGHFYDVVAMDTVNGMVNIQCWKDDHETNLHQTRQKMVEESQQEKQANKKQINRLLQFYAQLFCSDHRDSPFIDNNAEKSLFSYLLRIPEVYVAPPSPPPRSA